MLLKRGSLILAALLCGVLWMGNTAGAVEANMEDFSYHQSFEDGDDPVVLWATNGTYTVNYKGVTTERAYGGKSCYKLDVTFDNCTYIYWMIPFDISAEGGLKMSAHYLLGKENTAGVSIGARLDLLPPYSGYVLSGDKSSKTTGGEWAQETKDDFLGPFKDKKYLSEYLPRYFWSVGGDNVTPCMKGVAILTTAMKGARAVIYIDDVDVSGRVMSKAAFADEINRRWSPVRARYAAKFGEWDSVLSRERAGVLARKDTGEASRYKGLYIAKLDSIQQQVDAAKKNVLDPITVKNLDTAIADLEKIDLGKLVRCYGGKSYAIYLLHPLTSNVMPEDRLIPGAEISRNINVILSPGEYEPASVAVVSLDNQIKGLTVAATDLAGKSGVIPAGNVEIKVVKRWYQAAGKGYTTVRDGGKKVLVPELLVNDDSLVKVDRAAGKNYLKLSFPDGSRYVDVSDPKEKTTVPMYGPHVALHTPADFPVKDSSALQPVDIQPGTNQQFWITVHAPAGIKPGSYQGKILLRGRDGLKEDLSLNVKVLPINLAEPGYTSSIYYGSNMNRDYPDGTLSWWYKSEGQLKNELADLVKHGVTNPICYQNDSDLALFKKYMAIRKDAGIVNRPLYTLMGTGNSEDPAVLAGLQERVRSVADIAKEYGASEVYLYGADEAKGERLRSQRKAWQAVHDAGGKVFVSGYDDTFDAVGDLLDICVYNGAPLLSQAKKWHSAGHKVWSYANPQGGVENAAVYRRNYGFLLWQDEYDGACTFAYMANYGNIWNDFDGIMKDENMVYPTVDGVIDTVQWEGYREGIDDMRYLATLQRELDAAKKNVKTQSKKTAIAAAEGFVSNLKTMNLEQIQPDVLRKDMISHILALKGLKTEEWLSVPAGR